MVVFIDEAGLTGTGANRRPDAGGGDLSREPSADVRRLHRGSPALHNAYDRLRRGNEVDHVAGRRYQHGLATGELVLDRRDHPVHLAPHDGARRAWRASWRPGQSGR